MTQSQGQFELLALQAKAIKLEELEFVTIFTNLGLPQEVITRLQNLFHRVEKIGEQKFNIGKIIIMKLIEFVNENPNMAIGLAVGVGLSVLSGMLINSIPLIGHSLSAFITPIISLIVIPIGVLKGHRLDKALNDKEYVGDSLLEDLITISKKFWKLLVDIFISVKNLLRGDDIV